MSKPTFTFLRTTEYKGNFKKDVETVKVYYQKKGDKGSIPYAIAFSKDVVEKTNIKVNASIAIEYYAEEPAFAVRLTKRNEVSNIKIRLVSGKYHITSAYICGAIVDAFKQYYNGDVRELNYRIEDNKIILEPKIYAAED